MGENKSITYILDHYNINEVSTISIVKIWMKTMEIPSLASSAPVQEALILGEV